MSPLTNVRYLLACDRVQESGNIGTLMRTALALGWEGIFLTQGCADPFNDKALRASKGAPWSLPFRQGSCEELLALIGTLGAQPLVADLHGAPLSACKAKPPLALILGSEGQGVDPKLKRGAASIAIPMRGRMESLNVAAAGAILMYSLYE